MGQVLFTNVKVLDGSGTAPFAGEVLVEGNRIRRVARGEALSAPGAEVIAENIRRDLDGRPLLHLVDRAAGY